jgi:hypothetical protein
MNTNRFKAMRHDSTTNTIEIPGKLTATGLIHANVSGGAFLRGGDDATLNDINIANHMGLYGYQDSTKGSLKLGSGGGIISGASSKIGINTIAPGATLTVNGADNKDTGPILNLAGNATEQVEGGRVRFTETNVTYQGAYLHYNASNNTFYIGVHNTDSTVTADDTNVINILRSDGTVNITKNTTFSERVLGDSFAVSSTITDVVNNAPWYGIGYTNVVAGTGYFTQLGGYFGLNFKTGNSEVRLISAAGADSFTHAGNIIYNAAHAGHKTSGTYIDADRVDGKHASDLMASSVDRVTYVVPVGGLAALANITIPSSKSYVLASNRLLVFVDRMLQEPGLDYTEVNTTTVEFLYDLPADSRVTFVIYKAGA